MPGDMWGSYSIASDRVVWLSLNAKNKRSEESNDWFTFDIWNVPTVKIYFPLLSLINIKQAPEWSRPITVNSFHLDVFNPNTYERYEQLHCLLNLYNTLIYGNRTELQTCLLGLEISLNIFICKSAWMFNKCGEGTCRHDN